MSHEVVCLEFVAITLFLAFTLSGLDADFLVVLLESSQVFTSLRELTLLHTLTHVPVDEGTLGVHKIELVIDPAEHLSDGGTVGDHAHCAHDLGQVTTGNNGRGLVVDTALETSGRPVDELDGPLGLDGGNSSVDVLGDDITSVHQTAGHVLTVTRVALDHHAGGLEDRVSDLGHGQLLVVGLLSGDDGSVRGKHEVNTGVRYQVSLELGHIYVQGTIEAEGGGQRRDALGDQSVKIGISGALDVEVSAADIVQSLVIHLASDVSVLQQRVYAKHTVVWLNDGSGDLGARPDSEGDLGLLAVVDGQALEHQATETGTSTTTAGVEDKEALETSAVVSELTDTIQAKIDNLLTDGVVTTGEVVSGILLTRDQLLGVEQLAVSTGTDLINDSGLEIDEHTARDVLTSTGLREEGVEGVITTTNSLIRRHLTVRLDTVLETEELPAGVTDLDTSLTNMNSNNFTHFLNSQSSK